MSATVGDGPVRLAEVAGVLSLAADLAMGQPLEHGVRTAVLGVRLAQAMDLAEDAQVAAFYTGLLHFAGCTADSDVDARFFGDELAARPAMMAAFLGSPMELIGSAMRLAHLYDPPLVRAMARSALGGVGEFRRWAAAHCEVAQLLTALWGSKNGHWGLTCEYSRRDGSWAGRIAGL
jgi:hypothetical protein